MGRPLAPDAIVIVLIIVIVLLPTFKLIIDEIRKFMRGGCSIWGILVTIALGIVFFVTFVLLSSN
jgi:hypothetical protein